MSDSRVNLSILQPFTPQEIDNYVSFLRDNGEMETAQAVEAALEADQSIFFSND